MERYDLSEARIYVGTYAKYNEGSLRGKWIDLSECYDQDEFMEVCHELHQDEEEPELMFQDWGNIPEELIDEGHLDSNFFELRDELENLDGMNVSAFWIWVENTGKDLTESVYYHENEDCQQASCKEEEILCLQALELYRPAYTFVDFKCSHRFTGRNFSR